MDNKERMERVLKLRAKADGLESQITRKLPDKWEVGQRVRFIRDMEWACDKGSEATINEIRYEDKGKSACEYQVFWTSPDDREATWWTTPDDVELV